MANSRRYWAQLVLCLAVTPGIAAQTPLAAEPASLAGVVTNRLTGAPVLRAHVGIVSLEPPSQQPYGAMTNGEGKFTMTKLPPGRYVVSVERIGFVPLNQSLSPTDVTLSAGEKKEDFKLTLVPTGSIGGHVFDAAGEPVQGVTVSAERGLGSERATTDDKGQFRVGGLYPGKYRVKATPQTDQFIQVPLETRTDGSADVHYSPTYYPESLTRDQGARIDIQPAAELGGVDIHLVRTPIVSVSGRILGLPPNAKVGIEAEPSSPGAGSSSPSMVKPDGSFIFWRLDPGKYILFTTTFGPNGMRSAPVEIEVADVNLEHIEMRMIAPFDIPIQVRFEDEQAGHPTPPGQPAPAPIRRITLEPVTTGRIFELPAADIGADDSLTLEKVQAGTYRVALKGGSAGYVKSIRVGSTETEGPLLDVRNGLAGPVSLVVSFNTCQVHGTVIDSSGPVAGAQVLLQPVDTSRSRAYVAKSTAGGAYHIADVTPGKYKLLVVDADGLVAYQRGVDVEDYENIAESLDLQAGDKIAKDLSKR